MILDRLSPQGLIAVDKTLWSGAVADPAVSDGETDALRRFNDHLGRANGGQSTSFSGGWST